MVAGRERQHSHRVPRIGRSQLRLLPVAAIFGGNASGKTNFFRALSFAKSLVVVGTSQLEMPIRVEPFLLDNESEARPSRFSFELLMDDGIYCYSFSVTQTEVVDEELSLQTTGKPKVLYLRSGEQIQFHPSLPDIEKLSLAFDLTRNNQLFLTAVLAHNVKSFHSVYRWFDESLTLIAPDSRFAPFEYLSRGHTLHSLMNEALSGLDLGVVRVDSEEVPPESVLPKRLIAEIQQDLKAGQTAIVGFGPGSRYIVIRQNGSLKAHELVTYHRKSDGQEVKFELSDESDGSQRAIDLLPAFLDLTSSGCKKTYVIDEFDRSLHTILTRWLLEYFLQEVSPQSRSQLLFTTHDAQLIDQSLFRRDEIWVTETDRHGASQLISFSEYKGIRDDKNIRRSYLHGRFGGVPKIFA